MRSHLSQPTLAAQAVHFHHQLACAEVLRLCKVVKQLWQLAAIDFNGIFTLIAQQKLRNVALPRMRTGHKRIDALNFVDKTVLQQKIHRTIDRWRRSGVVVLLELVKQRVRLCRPSGVSNQRQYALPQRRKAQAVGFAILARVRNQRFAVVMVMRV